MAEPARRVYLQVASTGTVAYRPKAILTYTHAKGQTSAIGMSSLAVTFSLAAEPHHL